MKKIIRVYKSILPYFWSTKRSKIVVLLTGVLIGLDIALTTYFPYIWRNIIAPENQHQSMRWFVSITCLLFVAWFLKRNLVNLKELIFFYITNEAIKGIRLNTILKVHHISLQKLNQYHIQEIINATARVYQSIRMFMRASFISIFPSLGKLISLSVALFMAEKICLGILVAAFLGLLVVLSFFKPYIQAKYKAWHIGDNLVTAIDQTLHHTATIRFHPQQTEKQLLGWFNQEAKAWQKYNSLFYLLYMARDFVFHTMAGIVFCFIIIAYWKGSMALDKLVLIYGLISSMHAPLLSITDNLTRFFSGLVDLDKTFTILNLPEEEKPIVLQDLQQKPIQLIDVSFSYTSAKPLLQTINLAIRPGDKLGIYGASGTGKSTLCQLIVGLMKPHSGKVIYDHWPISDIQPASLGQMLTYIPQSHWEQELAVEPHEYGIQLKKKPFSPGEYQKHLLKKLLADKPQIVVLDEALSALDEAAASQLLQELLAAIPTIILVSHSKIILEQMERIYELKDGQLYEMK